LKYSITIDREQGLILGSAHGVASAEDFQSYITDLLKPPCSEVNYSVLTDLRDVDMRTMSADDVRNVAELVRQRRTEVLMIKHALVVSEPLSFGFARMYQTLNEEVDPQDLRIFYDVDEAREWVRSGRTGNGSSITEQDS
jgi:hypothetical protein